MESRSSRNIINRSASSTIAPLAPPSLRHIGKSYSPPRRWHPRRIVIITVLFTAAHAKRGFPTPSLGRCLEILADRSAVVVASLALEALEHGKPPSPLGSGFRNVARHSVDIVVVFFVILVIAAVKSLI